MHDPEQSDGSVVPKKLGNNAGKPAADWVEGRDSAKRNSNQQTTHRTQCRESVPQALERVRQAAQRNRKARFTALLHHVTVDRLRQAYQRMNRKAAPGVDGVTWEEYGRDLENHLRELHARIHRGAYRAKPSRRTYIPKTDGRQRPLGIASLEDKIVQAATVEVMNAIYEVDFLGFSYGFRKGRHQHQALDALTTGIKRKKVNWVLDADIRGFFDAIDHEWMLRFVEHRIADPRVLRLIRKWLNAGILEAEEWRRSEEGTPQGATVSPLLANIYLHYVFDLWAHDWRQKQASGEVILVRYADDFVVGFQHRTDAEAFLAALKARLQKFSLELHPDKTRLLEFGRFAARNRAARGQGKPETFTFLGMTHLCGVSRKGGFQVLRRTDRKRMTTKLKSIKTELRRRMHASIWANGRWLKQVLQGYFNYHAVPTNIFVLDRFRMEVGRLWFTTLRRRSQRRKLNWKRMVRYVERWLPKVRVLHPYPEQRFDARLKAGAV